MAGTLFAQLRPFIENFGPDDTLNAETLPPLCLHSEGNVSIAYSPFDYFAPSPKLAIVGITPGRVQAVNALKAAGAALRAGETESSALRIAKLTGSFSGVQTRNNLVAMLDAIGSHLRRAFRCGP
jgi:hypothetical protein